MRAFNAIGFSQLPQLAHRQGDPVGVPIAGDDQNALAIASRLIKEIGFEPVVVGGLAMGKYLNVRTPLAGVHTPDEIRQIAATQISAGGLGVRRNLAALLSMDRPRRPHARRHLA